MPESNVWKRIAQTCRLTDLNWVHGSFNLVQILTLSRECCCLFAKPFWLDIALILKWNQTRNKCQSNSFTKPAMQMPFFPPSNTSQKCTHIFRLQITILYYYEFTQKNIQVWTEDVRILSWFYLIQTSPNCVS